MKNGIKKGWKQYSKKKVQLWDDFIDWDRRKAGESRFFVEMLRKHNVTKILDIACGSGYDSIRLSKEGFIVKSCDGSKVMIRMARENAKANGVRLDVCQCDWRNLVEKFHERFDAVICLGNSFTHLFSAPDRRSVLNQIYFLLNPGGVLIIDQRNYDYLQAHGYKSKHKYVYCSKNFTVDIVKNEKSLIKVRYTHRNGEFFTLELYPIKIREFQELLKHAGFSVKTYGDFEARFGLNNTDFIQHVAIK